jgi:hypothetical protein
MMVCQAMTGRGCWPLTIIMTPDKKPFFAGTYFPKESKRGRSGLLEILDQVQKAWSDNRDSLLESSQKILNVLEKTSDIGDYISIEEMQDVINDAFKELKSTFDEKYGGFGSAPKFPIPHNLMLLLRYWKRTADEEALAMVEKTLDSMYRGGIYDHIGYGFSRYSTDRRWLVPHFEKMLYDNALLTMVYLETYQVTANEDYAKIAEEILDYILRDMTSSEGGFYSAEDADSEGEEGKFYVWTPEEVKEVLGEEAGENFCEFYDISAQGNFEGKSIPNLIEEEISKLEVDDKFTKERQQLFAVREERIHPHKDDKILTSWNGLMIAAMSIAARVLSEDKYKEAAKKAVQFIQDNLRREDGRLLARYREEDAAYLGYVDDYAFLIWGLIELYETTFVAKYLDMALELNQDLIDYFWDEEDGGLYFYGSDSEELLTRPKEIYDGALPSGNSVATLNFLRLAKLAEDEQLFEKAEKQFEFFGGRVEKNPNAYSYLLMGLLFFQNDGKEIVIVGEDDQSETEEMLDILREQFTPFSVVHLKDGDAEYERIKGRTTAYICEDFTCQAPITDIQEFKESIERI